MFGLWNVLAEQVVSWEDWFPSLWETFLPPKAQATSANGRSADNETAALLCLTLSPACWTCICQGFPSLERITWKKSCPTLASPTYSS